LIGAITETVWLSSKSMFDFASPHAYDETMSSCYKSILRLVRPVSCLTALMACSAFAQNVIINIDAGKPMGSFTPVWSWMGYDEPNYTYSDDGMYLLQQLGQLSVHPIHARTHNLLTSGDGTPTLKWGSTNAFTRDASGKPVYDWTIIDKIFDAYKQTGIKPLVEIGFTPQALSTHPDPYQHHWPQSFDTGWAYPPTNYDEWSELVYQWVSHMVQRYGAREVATWEWEVWNEPDIFYWHGTPEEYFKLYDHAVTAVRRALPNARVGGPASTGPASDRASKFLRSFLEHCVNGPNAATGKKQVPLDFISFHAKGKASFTDNHVQLDIATNLRDIDRGFAVINEFPSLRKLPVLLTESDPESCAACGVTTHPQNAYRLNSQYASYTVAMINGTMELAKKHHINLQGTIAWAFTFPGQSLFAGQRAFTTGMIDLPLLNAFRMFGQLNDQRIEASSSGAVDIDTMLKSSVREQPDINVIATRNAHQISALVWNYHDADVNVTAESIRVHVKGLPKNLSKVQLKHWRIDDAHSNAFTAWRAMSSPLMPSATELQALQTAGQLQLLSSPNWIVVDKGTTTLDFKEPRQGVSLIEFSW